jgi:hypothetical protein
MIHCGNPAFIRLLREREINRRARDERRQVVDRGENKQRGDGPRILAAEATHLLPEQGERCCFWFGSLACGHGMDSIECEKGKNPLGWRAAISTRFESAARAWFRGRLGVFKPSDSARS